jgi:hypothetical protein
VGACGDRVLWWRVAGRAPGIDLFHNSAVAPALGARALGIERVLSRKQSKSAGARRFWKGSMLVREERDGGREVLTLSSSGDCGRHGAVAGQAGLLARRRRGQGASGREGVRMGTGIVCLQRVLRAADGMER